MMSEKTPEIDDEIKILSEEIVSVRAQREKLYEDYMDDFYVLENRMTRLIKERYTLVQKNKYGSGNDDSHR